MRIEGTFKTPIHGISTLSPRNRADGHAEAQLNLRSDPVQKLTRRPSLTFTTSLMPIQQTDEFVYHEYAKDKEIFRVVANTTTGDVSAFKGNVRLKTADLSGYVTGGDIVMKTIEDTTYILNKDVVARRGTATDTINKITHINITSALNYGESITVGIGSPADSPSLQTTYTVPDLGTTEPDYDAADKARATGAVAKGITIALNALPAFNGSMQAIAFGSSVAIYHKLSDVWIDAYIVTGQGDRSSLVFGETVENIEGLPLYGVHGTLITIKPNPVSDKGTYYLQAERTGRPTTNQSGLPYLEEVVWAEARSPIEAHDLDASTLPHTVTYDPETSLFTIGQGTWKERRTGDDDSCPTPEFLDNKILDLGHFQNRLVFLSAGMVFMSETDDYENWFKASAIKLLVTDPVGIGSSAVDTQNIERISSHNRDLLLIAPDGQFKIDGNTAVTPQSVSMPKVSSYECQTSVAPVPMGDSVFLAIQQGESGGMLNYTTRKATEQEFGDNVSRHVVGLMNGQVTRLVGSVNSDMAIMMTDASNTLYVYEQYSNAGKVEQNSWSTWEFPDDIQIVDLVFSANTLKVITKHEAALSIYSIDLYSRVTVATDEVFLDYMLTLDSSTGDTITLPFNYPYRSDTVVIRGAGCEFELFKARFTKSGNTLTFKENLSKSAPCQVYVGVPVKVKYIPTRPFRRTQEGLVIASDRIRVANWTLSVVDTHEVTTSIISDYVKLDPQEFKGRIMGQTNNLVGEKIAYTGDLKFSYSQDASLAKVEFSTDSYLGLTIDGISWAGQYYKTSGRL